MRKLIIIFGLLPSMLINAQSIDWSSFNEKIMNNVTFNRLNKYTKIEGGYSLSRTSAEQHKIYKFLKKSNGELLLEDLSSEINGIITASCVGILDSISIKDIKTYQEINDKCITDLANSPSDAFFIIGWGKAADVTSFYCKRSKTVYISIVYQN